MVQCMGKHFLYTKYYPTNTINTKQHVCRNILDFIKLFYKLHHKTYIFLKKLNRRHAGVKIKRKNEIRDFILIYRSYIIRSFVSELLIYTEKTGPTSILPSIPNISEQRLIKTIGARKTYWN